MVADLPQSDDLAVGAVDLGPPQRDPGGEGGVQFLDGGEGPAGQDVVADGQDLALDPALPRWPVGGEHVGVEVVVSGERDRLRMHRNGLTSGDMPTDHGLGPVVDNRQRDTSNMRVSTSSHGSC